MVKQKHEYVNNKDFYNAIVIWYAELAKAKKDKKPEPPVPEYIGECILKIAQQLSHKYNFSRYPFKEEMIADAVENCLRYIKNFNAKKYKNPFAYYTTTAFRAFVRRIKMEQKHLCIKYVSLQNWMLEDPAGVLTKVPDAYSQEKMQDFIDKYDKSSKKKPRKKPRQELPLDEE